MICEKCGAEMTEVRSSLSIGMECPNCGWGWITTNTDDMAEDDTEYEIMLLEGNEPSKDAIKLISTVAEVNYLQAKKLITASAPIVIYRAHNEAVSTMPKAMRVKTVAKALKQASIRYTIKPDFPYEV